MTTLIMSYEQWAMRHGEVSIFVFPTLHGHVFSITITIFLPSSRNRSIYISKMLSDYLTEQWKE